MAKRIKLRRRILFLVATLMVVVGGLAAVYFYRQSRLDTQARAAEEEGRAAFAAGNYEVAVRRLAAYLKRFPDDAGVTYCLALAVRRTPMEKGKNILSAVRLMERALALDPGLPCARRDLMDGYSRLGMNTEALDFANAFLSADPEDPGATMVKGRALLALRRLDEARAAAEKYTRLRPDDPTGCLLTLAVLKEQRRPQEEIVERGAGVRKAHSGDPRFVVSEIQALILAKQMDRAREVAHGLVEAVLEDGALLALYLRQLSVLGLRRDSIHVLERGAAVSSSVLPILLVGYYWEEARDEEVVSLCEKLEAEGCVLPPETLTFRILSLVRTGNLEEALRQGDRLGPPAMRTEASAWRSFVDCAALDNSLTPAQRLEGCLAAAERFPLSAHVPFVVAGIYEDLAESALATQSYLTAFRLSDAWPEPLERAIRILLAIQRPGECGPLLAAAERMDSGTERVRELQAQYEVMTLPGLPPQAREAVWRRVKDDAPSGRWSILRKVAAALQTTPPHTEEALSLILETARRDPPPGPEILLDLAGVVRAAKLDDGRVCLDRYESEYGRTPGLALWMARSVRADSSGTVSRDPDESATAARKSGSQTEWDLSQAMEMDSADDSRALGAWKRITENEAQNPRIQLLALQSRSVRSDSEFSDQLIRRVRAATGDHGLNWRIFRAGWILQKADATAADLGTAIDYFRAALDVAPYMHEFRESLAEALYRSGDSEAAIVELSRVLGTPMATVKLEIRLAFWQQERGNTAAALERMDSILRNPDTTPVELAQVARLFAGQGKLALAGEILNRPEVLGSGQGDVEQALLLARVDAANGHLEAAAAVLDGLLAHPDVRIVIFAAEVQGALGNEDRATAILGTLDRLGVSPAEKATALGGYECRRGRPEAALAHFRSALETGRGSPDLWVKYLGTLALAGRGEDLSQALRDASAAFPDDAGIAELLLQEALLSGAVGDPVGARLVQNAIEDTGIRAPAIAAIRRAGEAKDPEGERSAALGIVEIADQNRECYALQMFAMRWLEKVHDRAALLSLARRCRAAFPTEADPARIAAHLLREMNRADEAVQAGSEWKDRLHGKAREDAMRFLAETHLIRGDPRGCLRALEPLIAGATTVPDENVQVLAYHAIALALLGRSDQAEAVLLPVLDRSAAMRAALPFYAVAFRMDRSVSERWLGFLETRLSAAEVDAWTLLAQAWGALAAEAANDASCRVHLEGILSRLEALGGMGGKHWFRVGQLRVLLGQPDRAEAAYQRAIATDGSSGDARNNLAMLLVRRGDVEGARRQALAAHEQEPKNPEYLDTLGEVARAAGSHGEAVGYLRRCCELDPMNARWFISLGETLLLAGGTAKEVTAALDSLPTSGGDLSPELAARKAALLQRIR